MSKLRCKISFVNPVKPYADNLIVTDGQIVKCKACDSVIKVYEKHQKTALKQHIQCPKHKTAIERQKIYIIFVAKHFYQQVPFKERKLSDFNLRLTLAFVQSGIPLYKINSAP